MEERPFRRGEKLIKYAVIIVLVALVVIGVLYVWGQSNPSCNGCAGATEGCTLPPPCGQIQQSL